MVDSPGTGLRFDTGIERIFRQEGGGEARLPELTSITPSQHQLRPQLDQILSQPSLMDALEAFVRPEIQDRDILLPNRFGALFEDLRTLFGAGLPAGQTPAPELGEAAALLSEEQANRDLLDAYRNMLLGA